MNISPKKYLEQMTSAELEQAIREHETYVRTLIEEVANRRKLEEKKKVKTKD